jgi:hypothetical protein
MSSSESVLDQLSPFGLPNQELAGWLIFKNIKGACKSGDEYFEFRTDLPRKIIGLENFGTNLAQLRLKSSEVSCNVVTRK